MQVIGCLDSQWINAILGNIVFACSLGVQKSLFRLGTRISFGVMTICSHCGDEGIYGWSFLSKYAFITRHETVNYILVGGEIPGE